MTTNGKSTEIPTDDTFPAVDPKTTPFPKYWCMTCSHSQWRKENTFARKADVNRLHAKIQKDPEAVRNHPNLEGILSYAISAENSALLQRWIDEKRKGYQPAIDDRPFLQKILRTHDWCPDIFIGLSTSIVSKKFRDILQFSGRDVVYFNTDLSLSHPQAKAAGYKLMAVLAKYSCLEKRTYLPPQENLPIRWRGRLNDFFTIQPNFETEHRIFKCAETAQLMVDDHTDGLILSAGLTGVHFSRVEDHPRSPIYVRGKQRWKILR